MGWEREGLVIAQALGCCAPLPVPPPTQFGSFGAWHAVGGGRVRLGPRGAGGSPLLLRLDGRRSWRAARNPAHRTPHPWRVLLKVHT